MQHSEADGGLRGRRGREAGALFGSRVQPSGKPSGCTDRSSNKQKTLLEKAHFLLSSPQERGCHITCTLTSQGWGPYPSPSTTPVTCTLSWVVSNYNGLRPRTGIQLWWAQVDPLQAIPSKHLGSSLPQAAKRHKGKRQGKRGFKGLERRWPAMQWLWTWLGFGEDLLPLPPYPCAGDRLTVSPHNQQQPEYTPHSFRMSIWAYIYYF